ANRALEEQLVQARRIAEGGAAGEAPGGIVVPAMGRVLSIEQYRATGATLARINLGTNDGVFEDQTIYVTRPGGGDRSSFVGHLRIIRTHLQWAVGRFDDLGTGAQVAANDVVLTSFRR